MTITTLGVQARHNEPDDVVHEDDDIHGGGGYDGEVEPFESDYHSSSSNQIDSSSDNNGSNDDGDDRGLLLPSIGCVGDSSDVRWHALCFDI